MAAANALPPVLAFDEASQLSLFASELHHLLLLVYDDAPADGTPVAGAAREGGKADAQARAKGVLLQVCDGDLRGRVLCATVGASDRRQAQMLRFLFQAAPAPPGTPAPPATPPLPAVVVFDKERNLRYPYEGGVDGAEETAALPRRWRPLEGRRWQEARSQLRRQSFAELLLTRRGATAIRFGKFPYAES